MIRLSCLLLGHSRGPVGDKLVVKAADPSSVVRYCPCCGRRADSFSLVRRVRSGEVIPRGFGVAWLHWQSPVAFCLPIPLNIVAGLARRAWLWAKWGWIDPRADPRAAYRDGYEQGVKDERGRT